MNKFVVVSCVDMSEDDAIDIDYDGQVVIFSDINDPSFMLFFPVTPEQSSIINNVINSEKLAYDINTSVLGIYKTMTDSWKASDKYLSGILMDVGHNSENDDTMRVNFALSNSDGFLDGLVQVSFIHAILVSVLNRVEILITDNMLEKLMPPETDEEGEELEPKQDGEFPEDEKILGIVQTIMSGKVQDD
jgi:hypothetical protein